MANENGGSHFNAYLYVAIALLILTVVTYFVAESFESTFQRAVSGLLIATAKAMLVVTIFMHLKWDWKKKTWFMIIPALLLSAVLLVGLFPDIANRQIAGSPYATASTAGGGEELHESDGGH